MASASTIADLHEALFGYRPAKLGTAYERISAVVLAVLGWEQLVHDTTDRVEGKLAGHQLDVTGRHPSGEIRRLIIECKDWGDEVGQDTLDHFVGVLAQVDNDAGAVLTTKGYTAGARDVAVDNDIALLRLRPFDPENPDQYIKSITFSFAPVGSVYSDWNVELQPAAELPSGTSFQFALSGADRLKTLDGAEAETLAEVIESQKTTLEPGAYPRRAEFSDGRLLASASGEEVPIAALAWTEQVVKSAPHVSKIEKPGEPVLVLEQLDGDGELESGRVVVDQDLFAWDLDEDGNVIPRGQLGDGSE